MSPSTHKDFTMLLGPDNFLKIIRFLVTGDAGFAKDFNISTEALAVSGATRAASSNSVAAVAVVFDADAEAAVASFTVPRDYDAHSDELKLLFRVRHVSGTSIALQASAVSTSGPASDLAALTGYSAPTATTINAAYDIGEIEVDLSGYELVPGQQVNINIVASATTGSGVAHLIGVRGEYRSTLVAYDQASR
jgi:hypothetical protein